MLITCCEYFRFVVENIELVMDGTPYKTTPYLTKFEFTRLLGLRVLEIMHTTSHCYNEEPRVVAMRELANGESRAVLRRRLPDGTYEERRVSELLLTADLLAQCVGQIR